jgi:selenide,water dikinase
MMERLTKAQPAEVLVGTETGDDAGVYRLRADLGIVMTADFITPVIDDPFLFGQVAASNSLSDVYAMGGRPVAALNLCGFPRQLEPAVAREILEGGLSKVTEAGAAILGGHTVRNEELLYGLSVTGAIDPEHIVRNVGAHPGDALLLTKPIGTGMIINGARRGLVKDEELRACCAIMATLNRAACETMLRFDVHAATDVTGFGLGGHGLGMTRGGGVGLRILWSELPVYPRARELASAGVTTSSTRPNREALAGRVVWSRPPPDDLEPLLYDPQTAGGLLIALPEAEAAACVEALHEAGAGHARRIGEVVAAERAQIEIIL